MHAKAKGNVGELRVAADLASQDYRVFTELGDLSKIDLIVEKDSKLYKIQVKAATPINGRIILNVRKCGPNYTFTYQPEHVDVFALYDLESNKIAYISTKEALSVKTQFGLRVTPTKNNQKTGTHTFSEYSDFSQAIKDPKL